MICKSLEFTEIDTYMGNDGLLIFENFEINITDSWADLISKFDQNLHERLAHNPKK